jgi:hypothetical protein
MTAMTASTHPRASNPNRAPGSETRARRSPRREPARPVVLGNRIAPKRDGNAKNGMEILVAIRSHVEGASLENVCLVVGCVPYAPLGASVIHPGETTSMIELPPSVTGIKAAIYFELGMGGQRIPLITDDVFDFTPGAVCVLTISDQTRAHNPTIEVEGAIARLARARSSVVPK